LSTQTLDIAAARARTGWLLAVAATFCFSLAPTIASAGIAQGIAPLSMLALRLVITLTMLTGTILGMDRRLFRIDRRGLAICILGGLSNGIGMLTFFQSLTLIHSSIASMIYSVSPLVTLGLLALRGEKFTYRQAIRVALGLIGLYFLIGIGGRVNLAGALLSSISAFTVPFITVLMQWYLGRYDARAVTFYTVLVMTVVATAWWWLAGAAWHSPTAVGWGLIIALALSTYLARIAMFAAIKRIGGGEMGLFAPLETFMTVVWSVTFLGDTLTIVQLSGGGLILGSAVLAVRRLDRVNWARWSGNPPGGSA
jgi:drug/metabolite transporter (DMT)-like permease